MKTALITGAAGLLGKQHALALLELNAHVILTDIDINRLRVLKKELSKDFLRENISNQDGSQATKSNTEQGVSFEGDLRTIAAQPIGMDLEIPQKSKTPAGDWWEEAEIKGWELEKCIPCAARIAGAEMAINDMGERLQGLGDILENNLKGILSQLLGLMEMFKDQGRSSLQGLCDFIDVFQFDMCPLDEKVLEYIIKNNIYK